MGSNLRDHFHAGELPRWVVRLLLVRDLGIILGSLLLFRRRSHIAVSRWPGKATTALLTASLLLSMVEAHRWARRLLHLALPPLLLSMVQYGLTFIRLMLGRDQPD